MDELKEEFQAHSAQGRMARLVRDTFREIQEGVEDLEPSRGGAGMQVWAANKVVGLVMCLPLVVLRAGMRGSVEVLSSLTPIVLSSFVVPLSVIVTT